MWQSTGRNEADTGERVVNLIIPPAVLSALVWKAQWASVGHFTKQPIVWKTERGTRHFYQATLLPNCFNYVVHVSKSKQIWPWVSGSLDRLDLWPVLRQIRSEKLQPIIFFLSLLVFGFFYLFWLCCFVALWQMSKNKWVTAFKDNLLNDDDLLLRSTFHSRPKRQMCLSWLKDSWRMSMWILSLTGPTDHEEFWLVPTIARTWFSNSRTNYITKKNPEI